MPDQPQRPNVLILCVDEMRGDHLGGPENDIVQTPNLERLARRGARFSRSYCNNPICMPARASMFTGLLPRDHGLRINGQALNPALPTLPQVLADAGYRTHAAGKLHLTPWVPKLDAPAPATCPESIEDWRSGAITDFPVPYYGFQTVDFVGGHVSYACGAYVQWLEAQGGDPVQLTESHALEPPSGAPSCWKLGLPEELHYNRYIADSTIRVIRESVGAKPFFAWCSFPDPHVPLAPPAPYCHMYDPADMPLPVRRDGELDDLPPVYADVRAGKLAPNGSASPDLPDRHWQEMKALTYGMISHVDAEIGRVLDALESSGASDNTLIVFLSDHGDMMGDHGLIWKAFYTFAGCIRIPTIIVAPGMPGGGQSDALISHIDLLPGVLDCCGIPMPGSDWTEKETPYERGAVQPLRTHPGRSWRPLLDGSAPNIRSSVVIENDDPTTGLRVRCLVTERYRLSVYPGSEHGELFDLAEDPDEVHNLWSRPEHAGLKADLIAALLSDYSLETPFYPIPPWNS